MERRQKFFYEYLGGTPGTKNWLFAKYQKKLWKMITISQINKIGWNLVTFKVIDRVLVGVSLIDSKNSWVSLIDSFFFQSFWIRSLSFTYLIQFKFVSHEPLDLDTVSHALQKWLQNLSLFSKKKPWKNLFFSKTPILLEFC